MIIPKSMEEIAGYVEGTETTVFFFTADWCGDCRYIKPHLPAIEAAFPDYRFVEVDRDRYMDLAKLWDIFGIPSLVVTKAGVEAGRLVNRKRKTKEEIMDFLETMKNT